MTTTDPMLDPKPTIDEIVIGDPPDAWAAAGRLELRAGDAFAADERSLRVDLCEDGRLSVAFSDPLLWPRRMRT